MSVPRIAKLGRFRPEHLLRPESVLVLGAETEAGAQVLANLRAGGFGGPIFAAETLAPVTGPADLAVVCADAARIPDSFAALARAGTMAAIVVGMAGGLRALAAATGVRALGPGSFGVAVPGIGLNASRAHLPPRAGRVALVSQSAALCRAVLDWAEPNGVGFSHIVGIGGNDDIGFGLVLDWLSRDPGTGAILLDIRRIRDPRMFLSAARAAARLRPVVAIRAGGRLLDPSGAADAAFEAALRRCGVLCVTRLEDLLAAAETLTRARPVRSEALAIVTNAIGPAWMAADAALRDGLSLAALSPATRQAVAGALPPGVYRPDEPAFADLVYAGVDDPARLAGIATLLAGAPEVGGVLLVQSPTGAADAGGMDAIAAAAAAIKVPLLVCAMGETTGAAHRRRLADAGVAVFAAPEQAVRGFLHLVQHRRNRAAARELPASAVLRIAPDQQAVRDAFAHARAAGRLLLTPDAARAVLAAYHVVAMPARRELRVRVGEDAVFGPTIGIGDGGAVDLPPLNLTLARALIARSQVLRGQPAADMEAVAETLVRVSQLIVDFPEIADLESDLPLAEVRLCLRNADAPAGRLAIAPYPAELVGRYEARGETFTIRPIRPEDAEAHAAFFSRLPPEDVRYQFFTAVRELSREQMVRLTQVDYEREIAFLAVREATGETVGVARLVCEAGCAEGEFAIVVQPDVKGRGLARHLVQRLIEWARVRGVTAMVGQVLADNGPMLTLARSMGFGLHRMPDEASVMEVRLTISRA